MAKMHPRRPHLRAWREHFGLTLEALAEKMSCAISSVHRWESGAYGVQDETFQEIARVYGITVAELSAPPGEAERARNLHRLMTAISDMDDQRLRRLADLAADLASPTKQ